MASRAVNAVDAANCPNSFSPDTKVATATGMAAIAAVVAGTPVLAYNEGTGKNEYRPVLEQVTHGLAEKKVTHLTLRDDESGLTETLTTTKGYPFYLVRNVDNTNRPAPEGHEDLALPWVGAGDLKVGDKVKQVDGTTGRVVLIKNTLETRQMYNLTVDVAHTYYVGEGQWLVHNSGSCPPFGFKSPGQFSQFSGQLFAGFKRAGYEGTEFFLQGSAVTGRSFDTGLPFDAGRVSDLDIAVINPVILNKLEEAGYRVKGDGTRVGPLDAEQLKLLGLDTLQSELSRVAGRPVNFMIFGNSGTARQKPSFFIPNPKP